MAFLQKENLQTKMYTSAHNSGIKSDKKNSSLVKYSLSELSKNTIYLETELPARKRLRPVTALFDTSKNLKGNDGRCINFIKEEKNSGEISNTVLNEPGFENYLLSKDHLKLDLNAKNNQQTESPVMKKNLDEPVFQNMLNNELNLDSYELSACNFEKKSENHDFETYLEHELCKNIDKVETSNCITEFDDEVHKCCELLNLDIPKITVNTTDPETLTDVFSRETFDDRENFRSEKYKFVSDEINITVENNISLESKFKPNVKCNSNPKINTLNFDKSVKEANIFEKSIIQHHDFKTNTEYLGLTTEDTLSSDTLTLGEASQIIFQSYLNDPKNKLCKVSTVHDSGTPLILCDENDLDESKKETSNDCFDKNVPLFNSSPGSDSKTHTNTSNEIEIKDDFIFNEGDLVDKNHALDDNKNCDLSAFNGISSNCIENKNGFDIKLNESFVSDYEISLLVDDTDSILSEESLDSEYEISLLEDDIIDEENQNGKLENESNSNVSSSSPVADEKNKKNSLIAQKCNKEFKMEENEQATEKINLYEKENAFLKNKVCLRNMPDTNIAFSKERIPLNNPLVNSDEKILVQEKDKQLFMKIKSSENNDKTEKKESAIREDILVMKSDPAALKSKNLNVFQDTLIKKELPENKNDKHFQLKLETINKPRILNKVILNNNKLKNSAEKAANKHLVSSPCTDKRKTNFVKIEMDVPSTSKSKQNINELKLSNKVVLRSKKKKNKAIDTINKQLTENTPINNDVVIPVKTELEVSTSVESTQDVKDKIPDYYEEEKEDLINPGWNKIRELSTDEERYQQVKNCWKSEIIPNPFKNLSYYSYRKRKINLGQHNTCQTKQRKRRASTSLNDNDAKRPRSCTYIFDDRIKSIQKEKRRKSRTLNNEMLKEVAHLNELQYQEEMELQNFYGNSFDLRRQCELSGLKRVYQQRVSSVTAEYKQIVNDFCDQYSSEIKKLKDNRNEVLQFYSFYKGLNTNEYKDPTILTNAQIQELEEIENIYKQMDFYYK